MPGWVADFLQRNPQYKSLPVFRRARHAIHFRRPDGKIEALFTGKPCHFESAPGAGDWQPIDTDLRDIGGGVLSGTGTPASIDPDGKVRVGAYSQVTTRLGLYRPSDQQFYAKVPALGSGTVSGNTWTRSVGVWTHRLTLTEDGIREELVIAEKPTISGVQAGDWLVLETALAGVSFPDGEVAEFDAEGKRFPLPYAHDANGEEAPCKRYARTISGVQYLYTGVPVSWFNSAAYPVTVDPDFAGDLADGRIRSISGGDSWNGARADSSSGVDTGAADSLGVTGSPPSNYVFYRHYFLFDTSSIGSDATVTQVNLKLTATADNSTTDFDVYIVKQNWTGSWGTVANRESDYDGALTSPKDDAIWRNTSGMSTNTQYTSGNLATAWVNKTGDTKYSVVAAHDYDNNELSSDITLAFANHTTPAYRPVLTVVYGSTFGKTTDGVFVTGYTADRKIVSSASPSSSGTVKGLVARLYLSSAATGYVKGVIYADSSGSPGALLATTDEETFTNTIEQEVVAPFSGANQINVTAGTTYWIGIHCKDPGTMNWSISRDNSANQAVVNDDTYSDGPSDPFGSGSNTNGKIDVYVVYEEGAGEQTITANGIASAEALGSATVVPGSVTAVAQGVASVEALGSAKLVQYIGCLGVVSAEAFGSASVSPGLVTVVSQGIASAEALGSAAVAPQAVTVVSQGIASAEALGDAAIAPGSVAIVAQGVASGESLGSAAVSPQAVTIVNQGVNSAEALGSAVVSPGSVTVVNQGVTSAEALGNATIAPGAVTVVSQGIASVEASGSATVAPQAVTVGAQGIASAEVLGQAAVGQNIVAQGIASAEAVGQATIAPQAVTLVSQGVSSAEALGSAVVAPGSVTAVGQGIASTEVLGSATVVPGAVSVVAQGIVSGEVIGSATITPGSATVIAQGATTAEALGQVTVSVSGAQQTVGAQGIASAEVLGSVIVAPGSVSIVAQGTASEEALGSPAVATVVTAQGVASGEALGSATITPGSVSVVAQGVDSAETMGSATISSGAITVAAQGIASAESLGSATISPGAATVAAQGVSTAEALGSAAVAPGSVNVTVQGIASAEAIGNAIVAPGAVTIDANGVVSAEAVGQPDVSQRVAASGIASLEAFGSPLVLPGAVTVEANGVTSAEAIGSARVTLGAIIEPNGIASAEALGSAGVRYVIQPNGVTSLEAFGSAAIAWLARLGLVVNIERELNLSATIERELNLAVHRS